MADDLNNKRPVSAGIDDTLTDNNANTTNTSGGKEAPLKPEYTGFCGSASFGFPPGEEGSDPLAAPGREDYMSKDQLRRYGN
jgi:hypothetical protein